MKQIQLQWQGKEQRVKVLKSKEGLWYHWEGRTYHFAKPKKKRRGSKDALLGDGQVLSPMPGKIMKILVAPGAEVKQGQLLLVMEAMKMEYSILAPFDGAVLRVNFQVGDQTSLGEELVFVEQKKESI